MSNKRRGKYFEDRVAEVIRKTFNLNKHQVHRFYESGMAHGEFGDIKTPFHLVIECKYYKDIDISKLLFKKPKRYEVWIDQLMYDVEKYMDIHMKVPCPLLVFSKPNDMIYAILVVKHKDWFDITNKVIDLLLLDNMYRIKYNNFEGILSTLSNLLKHIEKRLLI